MSKLAQTSVKYLIKGTFEVGGAVEKPDVIGALFGQTEGLLGPELDLRELQRTGRVGRIEVNVHFKGGKATGEIIIPSSLDSTETALIAASLETIDRIGPCNTKIRINTVEDLRTVKRKYIMDRAKTLLSDLLYNLPDTAAVTDELMQNVRSSEIINFKGFPAGPDVISADSLVLCEGRADVVNLLKHGVKNALAIGGTSIPPEIADVSKEKEVTVFLDGDRGGDLILKELKQVADIDFVARAPHGKEVEELTKKEIFKAIRDRVPVGQENHTKEQRQAPPHIVKEKPAFKPKSRDTDTSEFFRVQLEELIGTHGAAIFDKNLKFCGRVPLKELSYAIKRVENPSTIIIDGSIDRDLARLAENLGVKNIVGINVDGRITSRKVNIFTMKDLK